MSIDETIIGNKYALPSIAQFRTPQRFYTWLLVPLILEVVKVSYFHSYSDFILSYVLFSLKLLELFSPWNKTVPKPGLRFRFDGRWLGDRYHGSVYIGFRYGGQVVGTAWPGLEVIRIECQVNVNRRGNVHFESRLLKILAMSKIMKRQPISAVTG